jgi:Protein of unknown function (DUF4238)
MKLEKKKTRRQHYIPRFITKGFASRSSEKDYYTYLFRIGAEPLESNIINVGVGRDFYEGSQYDIESQLSRKESEYARCLDDLRRGVLTEGDKCIIGEMILNLFARANNIRKGFTEISELALNCFDDAIGTDKFLKSMRAQAVDRALQDPQLKTLLARFPKNRRRRIVSTFVDASGLRFKETSEALWGLARSRLSVKDMTKTAQLNFLATGKASDDTRKLFDRHWNIELREPGAFVLGDVGPIAHYSDTQALMPLFHFGTPIAVMLPISTSELLVGTLDPSKQVLEIEDVNLASIECSREFFVSGFCTEREHRYRPRIGLRATLVNEHEARHAFDEVLEEGFERN